MFLVGVRVAVLVSTSYLYHLPFCFLADGPL